MEVKRIKKENTESSEVKREAEDEAENTCGLIMEVDEIECPESPIKSLKESPASSPVRVKVESTLDSFSTFPQILTASNTTCATSVQNRLPPVSTLIDYYVIVKTLPDGSTVLVRDEGLPAKIDVTKTESLEGSHGQLSLSGSPADQDSTYEKMKTEAHGKSPLESKSRRCGFIDKEKLTIYKKHQNIMEKNKSRRRGYLDKERLTIYKKHENIIEKIKSHRRGFLDKERLTIYKKHQSIMEKNHQCIMCKKIFLLSSSLRKHWKKHIGEMSQRIQREPSGSSRGHSADRRYTCERCGKSWKSAAKFYRHTAVYRGDNLLKCKICGKLFKCKHYLDMHKLKHLVTHM